jgi:hypothetical protein
MSNTVTTATGIITEGGLRRVRGGGGGHTHRVVGVENNVVLLGGHRGVVHLTLLDVADNRVVGADRVELVGVELSGIPGNRGKGETSSVREDVNSGYGWVGVKRGLNEVRGCDTAMCCDKKDTQRKAAEE